jgi:hypothetical protein
MFNACLCSLWVLMVLRRGEDVPHRGDAKAASAVAWLWGWRVWRSNCLFCDNVRVETDNEGRASETFFCGFHFSQLPLCGSASFLPSLVRLEIVLL